MCTSFFILTPMASSLKVSTTYKYHTIIRQKIKKKQTKLVGVYRYDGGRVGVVVQGGGTYPRGWRPQWLWRPRASGSGWRGMGRGVSRRLTFPVAGRCDSGCPCWRRSSGDGGCSGAPPDTPLKAGAALFSTMQNGASLSIIS